MEGPYLCCSPGAPLGTSLALAPVSKLLGLNVCLLSVPTIMHQDQSLDTKGFASFFFCLTPVRSSPRSIPYIQACPKPAGQRGSRQVVGKAHEDNSQRKVLYKSCPTSILGQNCVLLPGSQQVLFHTLLIIAPRAEEGAQSVGGRDSSSYETQNKKDHSGHGRNQGRQSSAKS